MFRQGGSSASQTIALQGLDPQTSYTLTDVRSGTSLGQFTGAQLEQGLPVTLASPYSAQVISVTPN